MKISAVIILLGLLFQASSIFTFYTPLYQPTTYYQCIKPSVLSRIIMRYRYFQNDSVTEDLQNAKNALEAKLNLELIIVPTRCRSPDDDLAFLASSLKGVNVDRFWISLDNQSDDEKCSWEAFTPEQNCEYLQDYLKKAAQMGMNMSFLMYTFQWKSIFRSQTACPQVSSSQMWWFPLNEDNYTQIGGWKAPYMEKYFQIGLCEQVLYVNKVLPVSTTPDLVVA